MGCRAFHANAADSKKFLRLRGRPAFFQKAAAFHNLRLKKITSTSGDRDVIRCRRSIL
jgi:hypothetical protein